MVGGCSGFLSLGQPWLGWIWGLGSSGCLERVRFWVELGCWCGWLGLRRAALGCLGEKTLESTVSAREPWDGGLAALGHTCMYPNVAASPPAAFSFHWLHLTNLSPLEVLPSYLSCTGSLANEAPHLRPVLLWSSVDAVETISTIINTTSREITSTSNTNQEPQMRSSVQLHSLLQPV